MFGTNKSYKVRNIVLTFIMSFLILYFIYHSFSGERGVFVYLKLGTQYKELQNELESTRAERLAIEHKVNLLQNNSLDLDLLEEQAKSVLSYAKENEDVYIKEENQ